MMRINHAAFLFGAALLTSAAAAQGPCDLRTHFRIVTSMSGSITGPGELRLDSGWNPTAPNIITGSITTQSNDGGECSGTCTATANYGDLRCVASGAGHTVSFNGGFLMLDEWIGGAPKAQFVDTLTVSSTSLPPETPVQIEFSLSLAGSAAVVDTSPMVNYRATFSASPGSAGSVVLFLTSSPGTVTAVLDTAVGRTVNLAGALNVSLAAQSLLQGGQRTGSFQCDLRATTALVVLTPGATAVLCSGAAYVPPCPADFNHDTFVNPDDLSDFITCFFLDVQFPNTCPQSDFNADGFRDPDDLSDFITAFFTGC